MKKPMALLFSFLLLSVYIFPNAANAAPFSHSKYAVAEGWKYGCDERWHLAPVNEKSIFKTGEKVQFFAQAGPIYDRHAWKMELYKDNRLFREETTETFYPGPAGWNYSNFYPYYTDLPAGDYWVQYYVVLKGTEIPLKGIGFKVQGKTNQYTLSRAVSANGWAHGSGNAYWDLQPVGQKTEFRTGETVYLIGQVRNIKVNHSYKAELYREGEKIYEYATPWLNVGAGWEYGNFDPYYTVTRSGNYYYKFYINTGDGLEVLATVMFNVRGAATPYTYHHTYIAEGWSHRQGNEYWDLKPVNEKNVFYPGETVYALSQVRNISVDHRWKVEVHKNGSFLWDYVTPWNRVSSNWEYGNFDPYYNDPGRGSYEFKIFLDTGSGFKLLDEKSFTVR